MKIRKPAEDRKAEIVQTALALAFEAGPERVTTGMIAGHLGLTQPAIYKHFPRKDDIWQSAASILGTQIVENVLRARDPIKTPIDRLRMLVLGHLQLVIMTPALPEFVVARDLNGMQNAVRNEVRSSMTEFFNELSAIIEEAQNDGSLRADSDAMDLTALVFGVIQSLVLRMLVTRDPSILQKDGERLFDLQMSALAQTGDGQ